MQKRTWLYGLHGVKLYLFILAIISISLIVSVLHSQPAKAEGVLGRTLRCVVGGLLGSECPAPVTQTPAAPVAPAAEPQPAATNSNTNTAPPVQTQPVAQPGAASTVPLAPIEMAEPVVEASELPALPYATHRGGIQAEFMNFVMRNSQVQPPATGVLGATALEPSREGWKILGIAWYWWGIALTTVAILWGKKRRTLALVSVE